MQAASDVAAVAGVVTPAAHFPGQVPTISKPDLYSPRGHCATWPGPLRKWPSGTTAGAGAQHSSGRSSQAITGQGDTTHARGKVPSQTVVGVSLLLLLLLWAFR